MVVQIARAFRRKQMMAEIMGSSKSRQQLLNRHADRWATASCGADVSGLQCFSKKWAFQKPLSSISNSRQQLLNIHTSHIDAPSRLGDLCRLQCALQTFALLLGPSSSSSSKTCQQLSNMHPDSWTAPSCSAVLCEP